MNSQKIVPIIQKARDTLTAHYSELQKYFVTPENVEVTTLSGNHFQLWVVLIKDEYRIVYSEQKELFGLAFNNIINELIYLGGNGSLQDAIEALLSKDDEA